RRWNDNGWTRPGGEHVKNRDLWEALVAELHPGRLVRFELAGGDGETAGETIAKGVAAAALRSPGPLWIDEVLEFETGYKPAFLLGSGSQSGATSGSPGGEGADRS